MKLKVKVWTDAIHSQVEEIVEIDDDFLEGLSKEERDAVCDDTAENEINEMYHWDWEIVEE